MRILVYLWSPFTDYNLVDVLKHMHVSFDVFSTEYNLSEKKQEINEAFINYCAKNIDSRKYDAIISINYWPVIAEVCHRLDIKYISWSYDCPFNVESPEDTLIYDNVYSFVFDKVQYKGFRDEGFNNVYHLPLAVNKNKWGVITSNDSRCERFISDVSFVGSLYSSLDQNGYPIIASQVADNTRLLLEKIVEAKINGMASINLEQLITDSFVELVNNQIHEINSNYRTTINKKQICFAINAEATKRTRIMLLNLCGNRYKTDFYSRDTYDVLEGVNCHPYVSYDEEMPWIFVASKINLNPTLPSITSGVNLRAYDITGCGGFLLMNNQPELEESFIIGKEVEVYDSFYDFVDKLNYYMIHEDERVNIALKGRERCLSEHTIDKRLEKIFSIVFG